MEIDGEASPMEINGGTSPMEIDGEASHMEIDGEASPMEINGGTSPMEIDGEASPMEIDGEASPMEINGGTSPMETDSGASPKCTCSICMCARKSSRRHTKRRSCSPFSSCWRGSLCAHRVRFPSQGENISQKIGPNPYRLIIRSIIMINSIIRQEGLLQ